MKGIKGNIVNDLSFEVLNNLAAIFLQKVTLWKT